MALFFEYKTKPKRESEPSCLAWCKTDTILAVGTRSREINMFLGEGDLMQDGSIVGKCNPCCLQWHPRSRVLCSGWSNGTIVFFDARDCQPKQPPKQPHHNRITFMAWNGSGNRLVTGDANGIVAVWGAQGITRSMNVMTQYRKNGSLDHCVWCNEEVDNTKVRGNGGGVDHAPFFYAGEQGVIYYGDDMGNSMMVQSLGSPVDALLFYASKSRLVAVTRSLMLAQMEVAVDGKVTPLMKVKLSMAADNGISKAVWAGDGLLATCAREGFVRFWDLSHNENYHVSLMSASEIDGGRKLSHDDRVIQLDYNPRNQTLAAGTQDGNVVMWRNLNAEFAKGANRGIASTADDWRALPVHLMNGAIKSLVWGPGDHQLAACTLSGTSILNQSVLHRKHSKDYSVIQVNENEIAVHRSGDTRDRYKKSIEAGINIAGLDVYGNTVAVWSGKKVEVYMLGEGDDAGVKKLGTFPSRSPSCALQEQSIFTAVGDTVEKRNLSGGSVLTTLSFTEAEGRPMHMDANGKFLAVVTDKGIIKMFDVSRREPKQLFSAGKFSEAETPTVLVGIIKSIKCNADGTCVSILSERMRGTYLRAPDTRLHVYHCEMQSVLHYDFAEKGRYPVAHFWDDDEPRLLACETHKLRGSTGSSGSQSKNGSSEKKEEKSSQEDDGLENAHVSDAEITTLFATSEHGLLKQDENSLSSDIGALLGLRVPNLYFVGATHSRRISGSRVISRALRDFAGLKTVDDEIKRALLDFSFYLTIGDMDKAYLAVRLINEEQVWENMALMCVKTKRLDVAEVCLGNMGHARGARAVRQAKSEPQVEAQIAMVAVQLGLLEDAEKCYQDCSRWDLLNNLYQSSGEWKKALHIAKSKDRIHLRTTHYKYAKHLESMGQLTQAIKHYELSGTYAKEVPRMLFDNGRVDILKKYVQKKDDPKLYIWWGQYCESNHQYDAAIQYYTRANDALSLARVHCLKKDFAAADEIVKTSENKAAAYFVAKELELDGKIEEAIEFFSKSGRYNHAVRLAQDNHMDGDLMSLSLMSGPKVMLSSARYFESKGAEKRAVQLYQRAGKLAKALDLCFRARLFEELRNIADDLANGSKDAQVAPETLAKCASFLMENSQYDKAVHLYIIGGRIEESIDMCAQYKVKISEEMADKMTPDKKDPKYQGQKRTDVLLKLADVCKRQNSFHLATKKYTQAGDKLKAMKCLLKSGDTEKITFFANVSRNKEIYVLAANYLQKLEWHENPERMQAIITMYKKAKAYEQLSGFYDACAQFEIDEYRAYDKALAALNEAERFLSKGRNIPAQTKQEKLQVLQQRIMHVDQFAAAQKCIKTDPEEAVRICMQLLQERDIDRAIRCGDVFALLIEFHYGNKNYREAHSLIGQMQDRNIILNPYLAADMVSTICKEVGVPDIGQKKSGHGGNMDNDSEDGMAEDIDFGSQSDEEEMLLQIHK